MLVLTARKALTSILALLALSLDAAAGVLVVGPGGFPDIQAAVDAAQDGDLILVRPSTWPGFTIVNKSIDIYADPSATIKGPIVVQGVTAGKTVTLRGLTADMVKFGQNTAVALSLIQCQGTIWLEDCEFLGGAESSFGEAGPGHPALFAKECAQVVAVRCSFTGGSPISFGFIYSGTPAPAGEGATVNATNATFFECTFQGGTVHGSMYLTNCAPCAAGAAGLLVDGPSSVLLEAATCRGGDGQSRTDCSFCYSASSGNGGPGILTRSNVPAGAVKIRDSVLLGGDPGGIGFTCSPGNPGPATSGPPASYDFLPGTSRSLAVPGPVREATQATIDLAGLPNDAVLLFVDPGVGGLAAFPFPGLFALGFPPAVTTMLPPLPPSGTAKITVSVPSLPPGLQGIAIGLQALMSDPTNTRTATLSSPSRVLVLDSAY